VPLGLQSRRPASAERPLGCWASRLSRSKRPRMSAVARHGPRAIFAAALPASFRANPAQHFYALQQMLCERRRQQWREACDLEPDAFELAA